MRVLVVSRLSSSPPELGKLLSLAGLGAEPTVLVPDVPGSPDSSRFSAEGGVRIIPVRAHGDLADPATLRWSRRAIRRAIREFRPELIQLEEECWHPAAAAAAHEARRARLPLVGFAREPWPARLPLRTTLRARKTLRGMAAVTATSRLAIPPLLSLRPDLRVVTVPQAGVSVPGTPAQPDGIEVTLGYSGRLVEWRGVDLLLQAAAQVRGDWALMISGTGSAQVELEALAERLGTAARISWLGAQPRQQRVELLDRLDVLVAPYRATAEQQELVGAPVMLAMAHGIPVVATRTGVLPELLDDSGLLVPPDDVGALAEALQTLVADAERRRNLGQAGRRRAQEEFSNDAVARHTLDLWREIVADRPASG